MAAWRNQTIIAPKTQTPKIYVMCLGGMRMACSRIIPHNFPFWAKCNKIILNVKNVPMASPSSQAFFCVSTFFCILFLICILFCLIDFFSATFFNNGPKKGDLGFYLGGDHSPTPPPGFPPIIPHQAILDLVGLFWANLYSFERISP